jgi:hypothetical protein
MKKILGWILIIVPIWLGPYIYNIILSDFRMGWFITCFVIGFFGLKILLEKYVIMLRNLTKFLDGK